jgi:hypothetical protein
MRFANRPFPEADDSFLDQLVIETSRHDRIRAVTNRPARRRLAFPHFSLCILLPFPLAVLRQAGVLAQ